VVTGTFAFVAAGRVLKKLAERADVAEKAQQQAKAQPDAGL